MNKNNKPNYLWEYLYIISLTIIIGFLTFLFFQFHFQLVIILFAITIIGVLFVWKRPLSKKLLSINNILLLCAPLCITYIITSTFIQSTESFLGVIIGVAAADVFSFTRSGRNTLNAKVISNTNSLARLSICLPVPKKPGLQPILGVGDLTYYSLIAMFSLKTGGTKAGLIAVLILFAGQILNIVFIAIMKKRQWTKGFPATLFPGMFMIIALLMNLL